MDVNKRPLSLTQRARISLASKKLTGKLVSLYIGESSHQVFLFSLIFNLILFFNIGFDRVSLSSPGCPELHSVDQAGVFVCLFNELETRGLGTERN